MDRETDTNRQQPSVPAGNTEPPLDDRPATAALDSSAPEGRARRPSSRMPRDSVFYERVVPLLLIILVLAVAALLVIILWGVLTGTYA